MRRILLMPILVMILPAGLAADEKDDELARDLATIVHDRLAPTWRRVEAVNTLAKLGPRAAAAVPELTAQLGKLRGEETFPLQEAIARTLGELGTIARPAIPALTLQVGRDPDLDLAVRRAVDQIIAAGDTADLNMLIRLLKNKEVAQRLRAAKGLGKLGPAAKSAVVELTVALSDTDADVRRTALAALRLIDATVKPADAVGVWTLDLQDADEAVRWRAAKALGKLGKDAASAAAALTSLATDPDPDVRKAAVEALGKISP